MSLQAVCSMTFDDATEQALYNAIGVVISDEVGIGSFGGAMVSDAALRDAVAASGYHHNTDGDGSGNFKRLADDGRVRGGERHSGGRCGGSGSLKPPPSTSQT